MSAAWAKGSRRRRYGWSFATNFTSSNIREMHDCRHSPTNRKTRKKDIEMRDPRWLSSQRSPC
jgi:hypothetical protein